MSMTVTKDVKESLKILCKFEAITKLLTLSRTLVLQSFLDVNF